MAEPTTAARTIELGGLRFVYRETGPADGPAVVLLHALGRDGGDWDPVAAALAAEGHRALAPDLRGHGGSARPGEYSYELFRDDVGGFLDALGLDRVAVIGHSMGGCVGYLVAERWPDRISRLVVVDTPPPFNATFDEPPADWAGPSQPVAYDWRLVRPIVRQLNRQDPAWGGGLGEITAPTLILAGGPTSHIPQEQLADVAALIPDCRLVTIPDGGHRLQHDRAKEFLAEVVPFLAGD
jgi:pimeloyl-ACP methyl ester carboxylesterase